MFCSSWEPPSSRTWGNVSTMKSLHQGFLPHGFCSFQNYFYWLCVLPKPATCTPVFLDTETVCSDDVSEHIKARFDLILSPSSSHSGEVLSYLLMDSNWREMVSFPLGQNTNLFDFCSIGEYIIRCSGVDFGKMVPISHPMLLCKERVV